MLRRLQSRIAFEISFVTHDCPMAMPATGPPVGRPSHDGTYQDERSSTSNRPLGLPCAQHLAALVLLIASWPTTLLGGARPANQGIQAEAKELRTLAFPVRSIDPLDEDFSDLSPLKDALKGVTVVGLGSVLEWPLRKRVQPAQIQAARICSG